jgi:GNAT superfamily N-acetyltransferase
MIEIKAATVKDALLLEQLAAVIWKEHYQPIIGLAQVEYMLNKFQSHKAITEQMNTNVSYFIVFKLSRPIGYFSLIEKKKSLFISKFYLESLHRGQGIAHIMLTRIYQFAASLNITQVELTVNKYNPAYHAYLKLGFENIDSVEMDIGGGYIMDDYVMRKNISEII